MVNNLNVRQKEISGAFETAEGDVWQLRNGSSVIAEVTALKGGKFHINGFFLYELDADTLTNTQKLALVNNKDFRIIEKMP